MSIIQEYPGCFKVFSGKGVEVAEVRKEPDLVGVTTPPLQLDSTDAVQDVVDALIVAKDLLGQVAADLDTK